MLDNGADVQALPREFSSSERAVLRRARIDEHHASSYPSRLGVPGVVELIRAGVSPDTARSADRVLSPTAIIAFLGAGLPLDDTAYDDRFIDPRVLAEQGVPASMANAFPPDLNEADIIRLHDSGASPHVVRAFDDQWSVEDLARLVTSGVSAEEARPYLDTSFIPADEIATCVRAGVDPVRLDHWLEVVGSAVRTSARTLVTMALENNRIDDPERFRQALLRAAIASIDETESVKTERSTITDALLAIVERGGLVATSVPSAWNRQRILHVGPPLHERAVITVLPDEPVRFGYGAVEIDAGIRSLHEYTEQLGVSTDI